jgi:hypothetical protein
MPTCCIPMTTAEIRERAFRRLLSREVGTDNQSRAIAAAARRLCEHFARQVTPLIGDGGVAAICARSLDLTQRRFPSAAPLRPSGEAHAPFTSLQATLERQEPGVASKAAVAVLTTIGDLLDSFIGESLTTHLLREVWPDDFAGGNAQETLE